MNILDGLQSKMHGSAGLHSAMAINRQRRLRRQAKKRAAERRLSSRTNSTDSMDHPRIEGLNSPKEPVLASSIGLLHLGVCFFVLGLFLIGSGLLPDDYVTWRGDGYWNELVITGIFVTALGLFLIILNMIVSKKEDTELETYVARQLTRSRSGHRLERDTETGCLTTKHHRIHLERQREASERGMKEVIQTHSPHTVITLPTINSDSDLEKEMEEDLKTERLNYREINEQVTTPSSSATTPDARELLINSRQNSFNSRHY
ncbi:unnamed protein product [Phaedon cochleariae]|uniref:Uncharacterized protein n=1 Tax=Phaedon cochleariae TaxID=80249 RepID=A0A9N9X276_PHACE|nr:unnamed protein product [Phaedon cochleariae]